MPSASSAPSRQAASRSRARAGPPTCCKRPRPSRWARVVLDEAQAVKNPASETAQQLRRLPAESRLALTGTPIENGLGDLWSILDFTNPGLVGSRPAFLAGLSGDGEAALHALNGVL